MQKAAAEESRKIKTRVSARKLKMLDELVKLLTGHNTVIISSLKGMPSAQFQKIRKKLKGNAVIKVIKKNVMARAMEEASKKKGEEHLKEIEKYLEEGSAILFSELDAFELAGILADERVLVKAKPGQIALQDIQIDAGQTDIPAGPMISEFGSIGIKIGIEQGKIAVKESKTLVKQGEKISEGVAGILAKIEILPFSIGLEPIAAFDAKTGKTYAGIRVDKHEALEIFKRSFSDARALAISASYPAAEVIGMIIAKAARQEKAVAALIKPEAGQNEQSGLPTETQPAQTEIQNTQENAQQENSQGG